MNLLIDTHILLWSLGDPGQLAPAFRQALESRESQVWVSAISTWEIAIKVQSRKLRIDAELTTSLAAQQFELLPFSQAHAMEVLQLPLHHRDPFDRALIAQARVEGFTVMTADAAFSRYADLVALFEG